jgi:hypothetical protein
MVGSFQCLGDVKFLGIAIEDVVVAEGVGKMLDW